MTFQAPPEMFVGWSFTMDAIVNPETSILGDDAKIEKSLKELMELVGIPVCTVSPGPIRWVGVAEEGYVIFGCDQERFSVDVFSSNKFDDRAADAFLRKHFFVTKASTHWIQRIRV
jgi:hypothetical protein